MNTGKIDNFGVENIKSLATLIENQNILMDFGYYPLEMPISVPVIVLSDTRTMLKNTLHVPVTKAANINESLAAARQKLAEVLDDQDTVDQMRNFMLAIGLHSETTVSAKFEIPEEVSANIQKIFIEQRQKEAERDGKVTTDDAVFHRYLTLARYLSCCKGSLQLNDAIFKEAKIIEDLRNTKIANQKPEVNASPGGPAEEKQLKKVPTGKPEQEMNEMKTESPLNYYLLKTLT